MTNKYFIDFVDGEGEYEAPHEWTNLTFDQVVQVLDNYEFDEGTIYALSEQGGEEDVASWTYNDRSLVEAYLDYLVMRDEFDEEYKDHRKYD